MTELIGVIIWMMAAGGVTTAMETNGENVLPLMFMNVFLWPLSLGVVIVRALLDREAEND